MGKGQIGVKVAQRLLEQGKKWCPGCKSVLSLEHFTRVKSTANSYSPYCVECKREQLEKRKINRRQIKRRLTELLGNVCARCGYSEFGASLVFHHVNGEEKEIAPAQIVLRLDYNCISDQHIVDELDKCILLCANCHLALHAGEWEASFVKHDVLGWRISADLV